MSAQPQQQRTPLPASYVKRIHEATKRAISDAHRRQRWGDSEAGSPVVTMMLCSEVARLNLLQADLLAALQGLMRVCPSERLGMTLAEYTAARAVIAKFTGAQS